jgi:fibronectin type 3 domain-containing protein
MEGDGFSYDSYPSVQDHGFVGGAEDFGVSASDGTRTDGVEVRWSAVPGATGYKVFRQLGNGTETQIATPAASAVSYVDTTALPGTPYSYRIRARLGAQDGAPSRFDGGWRNVPAPTNVQASDGTFSDRIRITWTASTATQVTGYEIRRADPMAGDYGFWVGETDSRTTTWVDVPVTQWDPSEGMFFVVAEMEGDGFSYDSYPSVQDHGFVGGAEDFGVSASDGTRTDGVEVRWSAVPGATGYKVFRQLGNAAPVQAGLPAAGATSFVDTGAVWGTLYTYSVSARTSGEDYPLGSTDTGWRHVAVPANLAGTDGTRTDGINLTWTVSAGASGYRVFRQEVGSESDPVEVAIPTTANYLDAGVTPGVAYQFWVSARTPLGDTAWSTPDTGTRDLPVPTGLAATDGAHPDRVQLTWNAIAGVSSFQVFRRVGNGAETMIDTAETNSYADSDAVVGTVYTYRIRSVGPAGASGFSATDTGWRGSPPPQGLVASDGTRVDGVEVTWSAVAGATGYKLFRVQGNGSETQVATPGAGATSHVDTTAVPGTPYAYRIRARFGSQDSAPSMYDAGWRNVPAPTNVQASDGTFRDRIRITWTASPATQVTGYRVEFFESEAWNPEGGTWYSMGGTDSRATTWFDYPPPWWYENPPSEIQVRVIAQMGGDNYYYDSAPSLPDHGYMGDSDQYGLSASDGTRTDGVEVTWSAVAGATGYKLFRVQGNGSETQVATPGAGATSHVDTTALPGTPYAYRIRARFGSQDSAPSMYDAGWRNVPAPTNVQASDGTFRDRIRITWTASPATQVTGYRVEFFESEAWNPEGGTWYSMGGTDSRATTWFDYPPPWWYENPPSEIQVRVIAQMGGDNYYYDSAPSLPDHGYMAGSGGIASEGEASGSPSGTGQKPTGGNAGVTNGKTGDLRSADANGPADRGTSDTAPTQPGDESPEDAPTEPRVAAPSCAQIEDRIVDILSRWDEGDDVQRKIAAALAELLVPPAENEGAAEDAKQVGDSKDLSVACQMLAGDVNLDGTVDDRDIADLLAAWADADVIRGDINRDGSVDAHDLSIVLAAVSAPPRDDVDARGVPARESGESQYNAKPPP